MSLTILPPPYAVALPITPDPPLGALIAADLSGGIPVLSALMGAAQSAPWCPVVVLVSDLRVTQGVIGTFEALPGTWSTLHPGDYQHLPPARRLLAAVERRPVPLATTLAQWVERRLAHPGCASTLAACFGDEDDATSPPRTLTRRVRELGRLEVRDWRGLARLARLLATVMRSRRPALEIAAYDEEIDPRTLRRWLGLATDLAWSRATLLAGWEWVLESALRRFGYLRRREMQAMLHRWDETDSLVGGVRG